MKRSSRIFIDKAISTIKETVYPEDVDLSSFELKKTLNPYFWDNGELNQRVRRDLLVIARDFLVSAEIDDIELDDVIMTGSLANYNWNKEYSDIDLHIVLDFSKVNSDKKLVSKFFDYVRKLWNAQHKDLKIQGYPVEIYLQDSAEKHASSGVYSLITDDWIRRPDLKLLKNPNLDKEKVMDDVAEFMNLIDDLENRLSSANSDEEFEKIYEDAGLIFSEIKKARQDGMKGKHPEMSEGNITFKALRRNGYIGKLIDIRVKSYDLLYSTFV